MDSLSNVEYLLHRSEREAVQEIAATDARAAAIHQELCLLYVGRALNELITTSPNKRWNG